MTKTSKNTFYAMHDCNYDLSDSQREYGSKAARVCALNQFIYKYYCTKCVVLLIHDSVNIQISGCTRSFADGELFNLYLMQYISDHHEFTCGFNSLTLQNPSPQ